jgi:hypothetical protein
MFPHKVYPPSARQRAGKTPPHRLALSLFSLLLCLSAVFATTHVQADTAVDFDTLIEANRAMGFTSAEITDERKEKLERLARLICRSMKYPDEKFVMLARTVTTKFLKELKKKDEVVTGTNKELLIFLNENRAYLFCKGRRDRDGERVHYMEYAINENKMDKVFSHFLNNLMTGSEGLVPNVNVMVGPNKTLLDAMALKVEEYSTSPELKDDMEIEIAVFRRMYQAKYFHELTDFINMAITVEQDRKEINRLNQDLGLIDDALSAEAESIALQFSSILCSQLTHKGPDDVAESLKWEPEYLAKGYSEIISTNEKTLSFLNQNIASLWCQNPALGMEHYMSFAVHNTQMPKLTKFLSSLANNKNNRVPNVNVVVGHTLDGEPATFLDLLKAQSNNQKLTKAQRDSFSESIDEYRSKFQAKYYHELKGGVK